MDPVLELLIEIADRFGAPPGVVLMALVALFLTTVLYMVLGNGRRSHVVALIIWVICIGLGFTDWVAAKLPISEAAIAREFSDSAYALEENRLNARYPHGWGIAFADGQGGTAKLSKPDLFNEFPTLELPVTITPMSVDLVHVRFKSIKGSSTDARIQVHDSDIVVRFSRPQTVIRNNENGAELIFELVRNARDGIILIYGMRKQGT